MTEPVPVPQWMYDALVADGHDPDALRVIPVQPPPKRDRIVAYTNRAARRAAARKR